MERRAVEGRDLHLTEGPILGSLFRLAWPVMLSYLLYTGFSVVDAAWIGRLGPEALAAAGPAQFATWLLIAVGEALGVGATALVARRIGEGNRARAAEIAAQGGLLVLVAGAVSVLAGGGASRGLFALLGTEAEVSRLGAAYLSILFYGALFHYGAIYSESVLRAAGDTRTPMLITGSGLVLNAVLDPLLIFGYGPFPRLGIEGAALATVLSHASILSVFLLHFRSGRAAVPLRTARPKRLEPRVWREIVRIGLPASFTTALYSVVYLFLTYFLALFGTVPVAVVGVGNRLEGISYLVSHGISIAVSTLVGQNLGAGKKDRAERSAWFATALAAGLCALVGLVFLAFPETLFRFFSSDPGVIEEGSRFLRIIAVCQFFMGVEVVMYGAFAGAGDTVPPMAISSVFSLGRIPLAWVVAILLGWGPVGIWWMISVTCVVRAVVLAAWFRRNRWMERRA